MAEKRREEERKVTVLHLLLTGKVGGIEKLCRNIGRYSKNRQIFCFSESGDVTAEQMRQEGNTVYVLNKGGFFSYLNYPALVKKICVREKADMLVVHHEAPWLWYAAEVMKRFYGFPYIVYVHCNYRDVVRSRRLKHAKENLYKRLLNHAERVVCVSHSVAESLSKECPTVLNKIRIVYNGIPVETYQNPLNARRHPPGSVELIYVGRLVPEKGVSRLLEALRLLRLERTDIHLTVIGDGSEGERLKEQADRAGIQDAVTFTGQQKDVRKFLKGADIFVHAAVWEEGFGLTLVEAMSAGVIPVAVRKGAIPEIVEDGRDGFLVDGGEPKKIADAIRRAISVIGTNREKEMRENAIKKAESFSIVPTVTKLDRICADIGRHEDEDKL